MAQFLTLEENLAFSDKTFNDTQDLNSQVKGGKLRGKPQQPSSRQILDIPVSIKSHENDPIFEIEQSKIVNIPSLIQKKAYIQKMISAQHFAWTQATTSEVRSYFSMFGFLKSRWMLTFGRVREDDVALDQAHCSKLIFTPLIDVNPLTDLPVGIEALSAFLKYYKDLNLKCMLSFLPKLESDNFWFFDPIFRTQVRRRNVRDPVVFEHLIRENLSKAALATDEEGLESDFMRNAQPATRDDLTGRSYADTAQTRGSARPRLIDPHVIQSHYEFIQEFGDGTGPVADDFYPNFWIKNFVRHALDIFFPLINWEKMAFRFKGSKFILKIILLLLEYGLYNETEVYDLCETVLRCSERFSQMEEQIVNAKHRDSLAISESEWQRLGKESHSCRLVIAKICLHLLALHLDSEVEATYRNFQGSQSQTARKIHKFFSMEAFYAEKLFRQERTAERRILPRLTRVYTSYLMRHTELGESFKETVNSRNRVPLEYFVQQFLMFIGHKQQDFYLISLRSLMPNSLNFYRTYEENPLFSNPNLGFADLQNPLSPEERLKDLWARRPKTLPAKGGYSDVEKAVLAMDRIIMKLKREFTVQIETAKVTGPSSPGAQACQALLKEVLTEFKEVVGIFSGFLPEKSSKAFTKDFCRLMEARVREKTAEKQNRNGASENDLETLEAMRLPVEIQLEAGIQMFLFRLFLAMNLMTRLVNTYRHIAGVSEPPADKKTEFNPNDEMGIIRRGFLLALALSRDNPQLINCFFSIANKKHLIFFLRNHKNELLFTILHLFGSKDTHSILQKNTLIFHLLFVIFEYDLQDFSLEFQTAVNRNNPDAFLTGQSAILNFASSFISGGPSRTKTSDGGENRHLGLIFLTKIFRKLTQPTKFDEHTLKVSEKKGENTNIFFDQKRGKIAVNVEMKLSNLLSPFLFRIYPLFLDNSARFNRISPTDSSGMVPRSSSIGGYGSTASDIPLCLRHLSGLLYHSVKNFFDAGFLEKALKFFETEKFRNQIVDFEAFNLNNECQRILGYLIHIYDCFKSAPKSMFWFKPRTEWSPANGGQVSQFGKEFTESCPKTLTFLLSKAVPSGGKSSLEKIQLFLDLSSFPELSNDQVVKKRDQPKDPYRVEMLLEVIFPIIFRWLQKRKIDRKELDHEFFELVAEFLICCHVRHFRESTVWENDSKKHSPEELAELLKIFLSTIQSEFDVIFTAKEYADLEIADWMEAGQSSTKKSASGQPITFDLPSLAQKIQKMTNIAIRNSYLLAQKESPETEKAVRDSQEMVSPKKSTEDPSENSDELTVNRLKDNQRIENCQKAFKLQDLKILYQNLVRDFYNTNVQMWKLINPLATLKEESDSVFFYSFKNQVFEAAQILGDEAVIAGVDTLAEDPPSFISNFSPENEASAIQRLATENLQNFQKMVQNLQERTLLGEKAVQNQFKKGSNSEREVSEAIDAEGAHLKGLVELVDVYEKIESCEGIGIVLRVFFESNSTQSWIRDQRFQKELAEMGRDIRTLEDVKKGLPSLQNALIARALEYNEKKFKKGDWPDIFAKKETLAYQLNVALAKTAPNLVEGARYYPNQIEEIKKTVAEIQTRMGDLLTMAKNLVNPKTKSDDSKSNPRADLGKLSLADWAKIRRQAEGHKKSIIKLGVEIKSPDSYDTFDVGNVLKKLCKPPMDEMWTCTENLMLHRHQAYQNAQKAKKDSLDYLKATYYFRLAHKLAREEVNLCTQIEKLRIQQSSYETEDYLVIVPKAAELRAKAAAMMELIFVERVDLCLKILVDFYARHPLYIRCLTVSRILDPMDMQVTHKILTKERLSLENQLEDASESDLVRILEDKDAVCYAKKHRWQQGFGLVVREKVGGREVLGAELSYYQKWLNGRYLRLAYILQYKNFKHWVCEEGADGDIFAEIIGFKGEINQSAEHFTDCVFRIIASMRPDVPKTQNIDTHYHSFYHLNKHYYMLLRLLGRLMQFNSADNNIRDLILERIESGDGLVFFFNLWKLFRTFLNFMQRKNFLVKDYFTIYRPFYDIIDFFKNLCENNFQGFKVFFNERTEADLMQQLPEDKRERLWKDHGASTQSLAQITYAELVRCISKSDLPNPIKREVDMFDRPSHFYLINDILYMMTELVNGGTYKPMWVLEPSFHTPAWANILYRIVDDPNDHFYEIKYNVLVYLLALTESEDQAFIDFLKTQLSFDKMVNSLLRMVAKLYVYCRKKRATPQAVTLKEYLFLEPKDPGQAKKRLVVLDENDLMDEDALLGNYTPPADAKGSPTRHKPLVLASEMFLRELFQCYYKYDADFSAHRIMETAVLMMIFLYQLSDRLPEFDQKLKRYNSLVPENLISHVTSTDQTEYLVGVVRAWLAPANPALEVQEGIHRNEIVIWFFLTQIIDQVEIVKTDEAKEDGEKKTDGDSADGAASSAKAESDSRIIVYRFRKLPEMFFYSLGMRLKFIARADVTKRDTKLKSFYDDIPDRIILLKSQVKLYRMAKAFYYLSKPEFGWVCIWLLFLISIAVNVLMLLYYNIVSDDFNSFTHGNVNGAIAALSAVSIGICGFCLFFWLIFTVSFLHSKVLTEHREVKYMSKFRFSVTLAWYIAKKIVLATFSRSFILVGLCYILGLAGYHFFLTLPLFLILPLSDLLNSIVLAIIKNGFKLAYLLLIIFSVTNNFAILAVQYFRDDFANENLYETDNPYICRTYRQCLLNFFNLGMRLSAGISDMMNFTGQLTDRMYFSIYFFNLFSFTIVVLMLLGAFFGIVVDAFKNYKKQLMKHEESDKTVCFVCGMVADDFERYGLNFKAHVNRDHHIFSYFGLYLFLTSKPSIDFSGQEIYIHEMLTGENRNKVLPDKMCLLFQARGLRVEEQQEDDDD